MTYITLIVTSTIGIIEVNTKISPKCGIVLYKSEQLKYAKHTSYHNMYLTVRFPSKIEDVDVTTYTYMTSSIGKKVCFKQKYGDRNPALFILFLLVWAITLVLFLALLVEFFLKNN